MSSGFANAALDAFLITSANLNEKLAMEQTMSNPLDGVELKSITIKDSRWATKDGWVKMQQHYVFSDKSSATIHYVKNDKLMLIDDFKFK